MTMVTRQKTLKSSLSASIDKLGPCSPDGCELDCGEGGGEPIPIGCPDGSDYSSTEDCGSWNPGAGITPGTGGYAIDYGLFSYLTWNPGPLYACDSARIELTVNGFEVDNAVSGDFIYEIGLRDGDILLELNNMPLTSELEAAIAYVTLWLLNGEDEYELEIERNSSSMTIEYGVIATL